MEIETLELLISIAKSKMQEMPENEPIDGLDGTAVQNFIKLSRILTDAEKTLEKMKIAEEARRILRSELRI